MNIETAYDGHRDLPKLPRAPIAPGIRLTSIVTLSWGAPTSASRKPKPMHVIFYHRSVLGRLLVL